MSAERYQSRNAAEPPISDEGRSQARRDVIAAMAKLFPPRPYRGAASGGVILRVSNGTPSDLEEVNCDGPGMSPAWRRRMEKVKREIAGHSTEIRVREMAERITLEEIQNDLQEIRAWANSLQRTA